MHIRIYILNQFSDEVDDINQIIAVSHRHKKLFFENPFSEIYFLRICTNFHVIENECMGALFLSRRGFISFRNKLYTI